MLTTISPISEAPGGGGDVIDLSDIDANGAVGGNGTFFWITGAFSGECEPLRVPFPSLGHSKDARMEVESLLRDPFDEFPCHIRRR